MPNMNLPFPQVPTPNKPPKHLLSWEEAEERLNPYTQLLGECIQFGWDEWKRFYTPKHHILDQRARAAILFSEITRHAEEQFANLEGVKFERKNNSFLLYIGEDIILRFKKIGKKGRCSSIDTRQQMLFKAQMELPGMEAGTLLHAGYLLDVLQQDVLQKLVVCQFKNRVLWILELPTAGGGTIEIMPAPAPAPQGPRFEAKPEEKKKDQKPKVMAITAGKE
jgi:hypothetical protein